MHKIGGCSGAQLIVITEENRINLIYEEHSANAFTLGENRGKLTTVSLMDNSHKKDSENLCELHESADHQGNCGMCK